MAIFCCWGDNETVYRRNWYIQREIDLYQRYNHFYIPLESEWPNLKLQRVMNIEMIRMVGNEKQIMSVMLTTPTVSLNQCVGSVRSSRLNPGEYVRRKR